MPTTRRSQRRKGEARDKNKTCSLPIVTTKLGGVTQKTMRTAIAPMPTAKTSPIWTTSVKIKSIGQCKSSTITFTTTTKGRGGSQMIKPHKTPFKYQELGPEPILVKKSDIPPQQPS